MTMWITVQEVKNFHGLKPQHLNFKGENAEQEFEATISEWILQCQSLICEYCHNDFKELNPLPDAVKNVCLRLVSNMVNMAITRRDTPIIKVNDWTITTTSSDIFTDDLKDDLKPYIIDYSTTSDKIDIFAITGEEKVW